MNRLLKNEMRARGLRIGMILALTLMAGLLSASSAAAAFSITGFSMSSTSSVAGAHPDMTTELDFSTLSYEGPFGEPLLIPDGNVRDLDVELPAGLAGDPTAVPQCTQADFVAGTCPAAAQVGLVEAHILDWTGTVWHPILPVYLMEPRNEEETAELAFRWGEITAVRLPISVRTDGDYGLTVHATSIPKGYRGVGGQKLTVWGVPGDPVHDSERVDGYGFPVGPVHLARVPFLTNPSRCDGPLVATARANSYLEPDTYSTATTALPQLTGCEGQPFDAKLSFQPTSTEAGVPSGFAADVTVAQNKNPDGVSAANLRTAKVTLPPGVTITPGGAAGLGACDDADLHIGSTAPSACPDDSRIGEVTIDTPVLPKPIHGEVYLRTPLPGHLFRIAIVADDFGVHMKIPGDVEPDPATGQIVTTFRDAPQLPFSEMLLTFEGGPHAPLSNPSTCGTYTTHAELTPWSSDTPVVSNSSFTIDRGCGQATTFAPRLSAGMDDDVAGSYSAFRLRVTAPSGQQNLSRIQATLPEGALAKLAGVPLCADAQAASGDCPSSSQIGTTTVGAGNGSAPIYVPQPGKAPTAVYLAGPYKGAPYSIVAKVPAQAGPFDLGTVAVRNALLIDPTTAQVTAKSDPLPQILQGVPISYRDVRVEITRPEFTVNPTNCQEQKVTSTLASVTGATASPSSPFAVVGCRELGFKPKLRLALKGRVGRRAHPSLHATLTARPGDANIARAQVKLPKAAFLENAHLDEVCTRVQFAAQDCPASSIYGKAEATSPLVDYPLAGPVYLRSSNHKLPDLVADLRGPGGQPIEVVLAGKVDAVNAALRNTFEAVPDVPVTKFRLSLFGGKKGLIVMSEGFCADPRASIKFTGQNGRHFDSNPKVFGKCGAAGKKTGKGGGR
jgi:hypothetical protein